MIGWQVRVWVKRVGSMARLGGGCSKEVCSNLGICLVRGHHELNVPLLEGVDQVLRHARRHVDGWVEQGRKVCVCVLEQASLAKRVG